MRVFYCVKCKHVLFIAKLKRKNCKKCEQELYLIPVPFEKYSKLSLEERGAVIKRLEKRLKI